MRLKQNSFPVFFIIFFMLILNLSLYASAVKPIELIYSNGLTVMYYKIKGLSYSKIIVKINSGDSNYKSVYGGITNITVDSMFKGCKNYSEETIKKKILSNGVLIEKKIFPEGVIIRFSLPTENITSFLKALTSCLSSSNMYFKAIDEEKRMFINNLTLDKERIIPLLKENLGFFLFGKKHPYGKMISFQGILNLSAKKVKEFYKTYIVPSNVELVVLSSLSKEKIKGAITISGWKRKPVFRLTIPSKVKKMDNVFIKIKGKGKAYIMLSGILPGYFKVDRYKLDFFSHLIGGYFGSRANIFFSEKGIAPPIVYSQTLSEFSMFSLVFEIPKDETSRTINFINKFILKTGKDFPTGVEMKDGITSFIGKKFLQWQKLDQYYLDYLYYYKNRTLRPFNLKNVLLKIKREEISNLYKIFKKNSVFIVAGDDSVQKQLKGFYRVYSIDDF